MYLWNTHALAIALSNRQLSSDDKFKYLLLSNVMYGGAGYLGALFVVGSGGWLYWYEAALVVIVTYYGLIRCKDRYAAADDDRLLENCIVLSVPLALKLFPVTFAAHYSIREGLRALVANLSFSNESYVGLVTFALNAANTFHPFLIAALGTAWYYWRLGVHLESIATNTQAPNRVRTGF